MQPEQQLSWLHGLHANVKSFDDTTGTIECIVSVFNNVDRVKDVIPFGAFTESLNRKLPKGVWMHDWTKPIAKTLIAKECRPGDPLLTKENIMLGGLYIKGEFNMDTQRGREAYSDVKKGIIDEFSIGYIPTKTSTRDDGANSLDVIDLFEWSPVLVGCNPATSVVSIKSIMPQTKDLRTKDLSNLVHFKGDYLGENIERALLSGALSDLGYSLQWAFYTILCGSGTPEEKAVSIGEACDEFKAIALKVTLAVLAEEAGEEGAVEKAFAGICTKAFGAVNLKVGATFSAANKKALAEKVKAFNAMAKDLKGHAKDIEAMTADKDAEAETDTEKAAPVVLETKTADTPEVPVAEAPVTESDALAAAAINEIALLEAALIG